MSRTVTVNCIVRYIVHDDFDIIVPNVHILYRVRDTAPDQSKSYSYPVYTWRPGEGDPIGISSNIFGLSTQ